MWIIYAKLGVSLPNRNVAGVAIRKDGKIIRGVKMKERFIKYFKENWKWVIAFAVIMILDTILTLWIIHNELGYEANPFIGDKVFDWTFHWFRIDMVFIIILLVALMPLSFKFVRNWLIQGITVGYSWSVINALFILLWKIDIGIYQFIPGWAYFFGILFQFGIGLLVLWMFRKIFQK